MQKSPSSVREMLSQSLRAVWQWTMATPWMLVSGEHPVGADPCVNLVQDGLYE